MDYRAIFEHFDALQVGLTATPTDCIDHNTFTLFDCPDGLPTFHYSYDEAIGIHRQSVESSTKGRTSKLAKLEKVVGQNRRL